MQTIEITDARNNEHDNLNDKLPRSEPEGTNVLNIPEVEKKSGSSKAIEIANPIELTWKNLNIDAFVNKPVKDANGKTKTIVERRAILKNLSGTLKPGNFTAILGPSGIKY